MNELLLKQDEEGAHDVGGGEDEEDLVDRSATVFKAQPVPDHVYEPILKNMIQENPQRFNKKSRAYLTR